MPIKRFTPELKYALNLHYNEQRLSPKLEKKYIAYVRASVSVVKNRRLLLPEEPQDTIEKSN